MFRLNVPRPGSTWNAPTSQRSIPRAHRYPACRCSRDGTRRAESLSLRERVAEGRVRGDRFALSRRIPSSLRARVPARVAGLPVTVARLPTTVEHLSYIVAPVLASVARLPTSVARLVATVARLPTSAAGAATTGSAPSHQCRTGCYHWQHPSPPVSRGFPLVSAGRATLGRSPSHQ